MALGRFIPFQPVGRVVIRFAAEERPNQPSGLVG